MRWVRAPVVGATILFLFTGCSILATKKDLEDMRQEWRRAVGYDGEYDYATTLFRGDLEKIFSDWPRIWGSGRPVVVNKETGERTVLDVSFIRGRAHVIPPYVFTNRHIVKNYLSSARFGVGKEPDEMQDEEYWLEIDPQGSWISLKKIALSETEDDLAVFEMVEASGNYTTIPAPPFIIGRSDELKIGHVVFVAGSPAMHGFALRQGVVSGFGRTFSEGHKLPFGLKLKDVVIFSAPITTGDSGSPVIALRDGRPELVGIVASYLWYDNVANFGVMIPIDLVVEKIKKLTGIDLREVNEKYRQKVLSPK